MTKPTPTTARNAQRYQPRPPETAAIGPTGQIQYQARLSIGKRLAITITTVQARVEAAGGRPELAVLHYKPTESLFAKLRPDYYAAITDEHIVYPWEIDRDIKGLRLRTPE